MTCQNKSKRMSDRLITLLAAYTLCTEATNHQRVLKKHVTETMFSAGIISYYSIFKNNKEKRWIKDVLSHEKAPNGLKFKLKRALVGVGGFGKSIDQALIEIFERFETIRDKNLAHKDSDRRPENKVEWLRIPDEVGGSDPIRGTNYVAYSAFLSLSPEEQIIL